MPEYDDLHYAFIKPSPTTIQSPPFQRVHIPVAHNLRQLKCTVTDSQKRRELPTIRAELALFSIFKIFPPVYKQNRLIPLLYPTGEMSERSKEPG
jgi:hypothetical protein